SFITWRPTRRAISIQRKSSTTAARSDSCCRENNATFPSCVRLCGRDRDEPERSVARLCPQGDAANAGREARSQRSAAASSQREGRFLGNMGKPPAAEWTTWPDGSESQSCDGSSARSFRKRRTELQGRIAVHAMGSRTPEAAHVDQLEGQPGCALPS